MKNLLSLLPVVTLLLLSVSAWSAPAEQNLPFEKVNTTYDELKSATGQKLEDWERPIDLAVRVLTLGETKAAELTKRYWAERTALESTAYAVPFAETTVTVAATEGNRYRVTIASPFSAFPLKGEITAEVNTAAEKKTLDALLKSKAALRLNYVYRWVDGEVYKVLADSVEVGELKGTTFTPQFRLLIDGEATSMYLCPRTKPTALTPLAARLWPTLPVQGGTMAMKVGDNRLKANVTLTSFRMSTTEMTLRYFYDTMAPSKPEDLFDVRRVKSYNQSEKAPWTGGSWLQAIEFLNERSRLDGLEPVYTVVDAKTGQVEQDLRRNGWRLPTDAEFVYASRGGQRSLGYAYSGSNNADEVAWIKLNDKIGGSVDVGTLKPNELGLYDLSGNLWEFVWDWAGPVDGKSFVDPTGPVAGSNRLVRGSADGQNKTMLLIDNSRYPYEYNVRKATSLKVGFRMVRR